MIPFALQYVLVFIATFLITVILTPMVKLLAVKIGAVDHPNARRINKVPMPSAGGLAIIIAFSIAVLVLLPMIVKVRDIRGHDFLSYAWPVVLSGWIVGLTGLIDDIVELSAKWKLLGQAIAAFIVYAFTDFHFDKFKIPFGGPFIEFSPIVTFVVTVIWIVGIMNAVNLMDGLDGLVSGVSIISLITMGIVSYFFLFDSNLFLTLMIFILVAAILGFLPYNYNPAIIYLGDTGALFIGFLIAVFSLQGLKNATAVAVVTPMIILGVPITDTVMAIIRRTLSKQKFYEPDKMHLHHRLLSLGLTHRGTVLMIYAISFIFSSISLLFNISSRLGGTLLVIALVFGIWLLAELTGILGENRTPILNLLRFIGNSGYRREVLEKHKQKSKK
ncbi:glycosyltransferase family 4 protein [Streptococcus moroccensis]|uniref:UDP-GlcNAc:undecaprenyl-phosphate GlcNAc-1-phosphate transferase n=1 Tax=Streptococcus moroccensis TaxID=1451356 RepID=A0ABT9YU89_9STRE|nr:MraY family glycosyltransferase [Streptococcus moroccensis]MDQ0223350.1 UDP-GlcNAc:undecaprenyl-phosphate GlcNAc-1-phosphate transferase [Streptococcus moroccensis]